MVGRLVEKEHIRLLEKQTTESHATTLTARKVFHLPVAWRTMQGIHSTFKLRVYIPCIGSIDDILHLALTLEELVHLVLILVVFRQSELLVYLVILIYCIIDMLNALHHILLDGLVRVELRILLKIPYRIARAPYHLALELIVDSGNNLHEGGLTGTVKTDDTDLCAIEETQVDVLQYLLLILWDDLRHTHHGENDFLVVNCCHYFLVLLIIYFCLQI